MHDAGFPRTTVGGVSFSRMIVGTNWMLGWSHTSAAADALIARAGRNPEAIAAVVGAFLERGVDAVMGLFSDNPVLGDGVKMAEDRVGRGVVRIDTPIIDVADSAGARRRAAAALDRSRASGAVFCMPPHTAVEQLVDKGRQLVHRLPDYLSMIRERGMVPGLSAHMPEVVVYADANGYDVEAYIQIYNCAGFLMQVEIEYIHRVIWNAKKPVMTIKPMAAGRVSPFVGLSFSWATIRPCDLVAVGCLTPEEAAEDVEISLAAIERRRPDIEGRSSPKRTEIMK
ncbi:MAG: hypothetical protein A2177_05650 [Spirochaetes bacterium RBG_13_68_11]|nr:MAG: hypothetical protein A2177_05650 [Spirochaetes bacterium RBG_13_68_11]